MTEEDEKGRHRVAGGLYRGSSKSSRPELALFRPETIRSGDKSLTLGR